MMDNIIKIKHTCTKINSHKTLTAESFKQFQLFVKHSTNAQSRIHQLQHCCESDTCRLLHLRSNTPQQVWSSPVERMKRVRFEKQVLVLLYTSKTVRFDQFSCVSPY
jgi:hypothetical protein